MEKRIFSKDSFDRAQNSFGLVIVMPFSFIKWLKSLSLSFNIAILTLLLAALIYLLSNRSSVGFLFRNNKKYRKYVLILSLNLIIGITLIYLGYDIAIVACPVFAGFYFLTLAPEYNGIVKELIEFEDEGEGHF